MTNKLPSFLKRSDPQRGQSRKNHLSERWSRVINRQINIDYRSGLFAVSDLFEDDRLLVPHRVDGVVVLGGFGLEGFPPGVRRKSKHLHLHIDTHPPLSHELAWDHLHTTVRTVYIIYGSNICFLHQSHERFKRLQLYLHGERVGHDAVHRVFCEGVEVFVRSSHELRLQSVAAPAVVLEHEEIQLRGQIWNNKEKLILSFITDKSWELLHFWNCWRGQEHFFLSDFQVLHQDFPVEGTKDKSYKGNVQDLKRRMSPERNIQPLKFFCKATNVCLKAELRGFNVNSQIQKVNVQILDDLWVQ